jgi:CTP synthase
MGITPDIIVLRTDEKIEDMSIFGKIAHFCNVKEDCVIENTTLPILYEAPLMLERSGMSDIVCRGLGLDCPPPDVTEWEALINRIISPSNSVTIGLVGKYTQLHDAYLSVAEALHHAGYFNDATVNIKWIDSEGINADNYREVLSGVDGIIVPGGFGGRGIEGMILTAQYCREEGVPYLGICLGMQIAVIEAARNLLGYADANSNEFDPESDHKVIDFMPGQSDEVEKGGTLRLGSYPCNITPGTKMEKCYGTLSINERHRHRYEVNNDYRERFIESGARFAGTAPDDSLVEEMEIPGHKFYLGVQYHPEFKSRPDRAHPIFKKFIEASKG